MWRVEGARGDVCVCVGGEWVYVDMWRVHEGETCVCVEGGSMMEGDHGITDSAP